MDPSNYVEFRLTQVTNITPDIREFVYQVVATEGNPKRLPVYPITSCVRVKTPLGDIVRPYTPTDQDEQSLHFIIKIYPLGKMTQYLANQKIGDKILIQGPLPKITYAANKWKNIGMIAGGTGFTPMWQVIKEVLENPEDQTQITLLYSTKMETDIIYLKKLEELALKHPNFKLYLVVSSPSQAWAGISGRIQKGMITHYLPAPSRETLVLVCGPDPMVNDLAGPKGPDYSQGPLGGVLKELGYPDVYKF
eukprot:Gregarina_sp_Pseudo_9__2074@NODE_2440_length_994_cov_257_782199_g2246_i0_p1_GENE_NODE_2440_length_994_cov_257_782199_g2246_i0NODE_2440_length_994_cov_257_782199_g2246_i0_p1_ORF_typecomplete_len265_score25_46NAD_binding_1/PF00175_21/5_9e30FAD_binding_6/PF00970_24/1_2e15NAD_binding_6/PF08030_12/2_1e06_NODE_2440_length_994_cov_257_782199_g2246_i0200949